MARGPATSAAALLLAAGLTLALAADRAAAGTPPGLASAPESQPWARGRLYLKLRAVQPDGRAKPSLGLTRNLGASLETAHTLAHVRPGEKLPAGLERLFELRLPETTDVPRLAARLSRLPEVEYAEPVRIYQTVAAGRPQPTPEFAPNDPSYTGGQQAYLALLQVEQAWNVIRSENGSPRPIVTVVDGGTNWQHEDLLANVWTNPGEIPGNGIDDDSNGYIDDVHGWNFKDGTGSPRGDFAGTPGNANHGTHTGGSIAGVTNNGLGIAASSFNPLLMAVNASADQDGGIAYGYEGITYAAENGSRVISLSWGGFGGGQAEQDVIDFATAHGALVLGAAGNSNTNIPFYPAAYRGVIAVANTMNNDARYNGPSGSDFGGWLDVAAPGTTIYSTFDMGTTNSYGNSTGTSMSCPVAASVAALIVAQHPTWAPLKVGEQLRVSCDNINAANPGFIDQLGKGRVNAFRAVTLVSPGVRATTWSFADANSNGELNQGETVVMSLTVHDYLAPAVSPSFTLSTTSPYVTITDGAQAGSTILEDADLALPGAFAFTVSPNAPPGTTLDLRVDIAAAGYADFQFIPITLEPVFETHDINKVHVSLTGTGNVGWVGFPSSLGDKGAGFTFENGPNVLFEGALLLGTDATHLSDSARFRNEHFDFAPALHGPPVKVTPGAQTDQEIHAAFTDSINATTRLGVRVNLSSWANAAAPNDHFVILAYKVKNTTVAQFDSLWAALWFDWDIDETHFDTNRTAYDASRRLGYAWDTTPGLPYVGVMAMSGAVAAFSAIRNDGAGMPWSLNDGFAKSEKWDVLQRGTGVLAAGPADISDALSTGPYRVPAGSTAYAFFALLAGHNLAELQASADRAVTFFADSITTAVASGPPGAREPIVELGEAAPNPFNPGTSLDLVVRQTRDVSVEIFDARGRQVRTLFAGKRQPGNYTLRWNGRDGTGRRVASGVYFACLRTGSLRQMQRLVLAK